MAHKISQRSDNRRAAMQFLYAWEYNRPDVLKDSIRSFLENETKEREYFQFTEFLIMGVLEHIETIDAEIRALAKNWTFERIARVDLAILRIAIFELKFCNDIPPVVSINEAVELGKNFSKDDSKRFINGMLDHIKDGLDRPSRRAANQSKDEENLLDGLVD
jgi:transcription antitermination protein NusB